MEKDKRLNINDKKTLLDIEGKKKNIIARHTLLFLICLLAFVVLVALIYIFCSLFVGGNDPYGDRLKGINDVKISNTLKKDVVSFLEGKDEVTKASVRVQGKIIYVHINVKEGVSLAKGKEIANSSLGKFSDEEKKYYDFGYFLKEDKDKGFVVTGTKNVKADGIAWIKS